VRSQIFSAKIRTEMSDLDHKNEKSASLLPPGTRVALGFALPVVGAITVFVLGGGAPANGVENIQTSAVLFLGPLAIISWLLGMSWYGLAGMGMRGRRPLFAGIGFSVLGWLAFLLLRFYFVQMIGSGQANSGRSFVYLLLFESFAVQVWVFGLLFRGVADWRGPLTAAIVSGLIFGAVANLFYQEAFVSSASSFFYFGLWGILFGIIRLRTGSLLGTVVVQAMQSFTAWVVLVPSVLPDPNQLRSLYLASGVVFLVILWRLWPKQVEDYRV